MWLEGYPFLMSFPYGGSFELDILCIFEYK